LIDNTAAYKLKKVLYISYDGMTDPLGQSQILPYLVGLSKEGYEFTILSFEKEDRFKKLKKAITEITAEAGIRWVPLKFTSKPPVIAKFYDRIKMRQKAFSLCRESKYDMIHCRGYVSAEVGLLLKRKKGIKFFFDMRGFWADEKKDGNAWNQNNLIFRNVYKHYKKKEAQFIREADYIISLTEAGKKEILKWPSYSPNVPLSVIPCCADMDIFSLASPTDKIKGRCLLGLSENELVISYLGSLGSWYMLDEMLELFAVIKEKFTSAKFLFVTHSPASMILSKLSRYNIKESDVLISEALRNEVPLFVKASDINISFIKPVYSKLSSSPTKLAEVLAMGIPIVVNSGVGDVKSIVEKSKGGIVIDQFTRESYIMIRDAIPELLRSDSAKVRENIEHVFSLRHGIELYKDAYKKVWDKS
jgi:glycosyltransferase involved in cell wall biosynthesis